ncbi:MAG: MerR family transcriptional regulator [Armatimonadetes bacterium]|nr:MerR family transcriptional regulator [Armatimonadota bacterium]
MLQSSCEPGGESKRVRWEPNERLVRYYTTLGLLDRPAEMRGRTAYYGPRHVLQLLAIKSLQAEAYDLKQVQETLAGLPNRELEKIAGVPHDWKQRLAKQKVSVDGKAPVRREARFWESRPAPAAWQRAEQSTGPRVLRAVELGPGVTLMLDSGAYEELDPGEIAGAADGLLQYLRDRRKPGVEPK